jgi:hypothetical protein
MKKIFRNAIHNNDRSHEVVLKEYKDKKFKFTYEAYNAVERCAVEAFDGNQWHHIFSLLDAGIEPDKTSYIISGIRREEKAELYFKKLEKMIVQLMG